MIGDGIWIALEKCIGFEWDEHNTIKIWTKHQVAPVECEQVFFSNPFVVSGTKWSFDGQRFYALGQTGAGRQLFVVFTLRRELIRVISARDMSRKERKVYSSS